ncbi:MAG: hypothetical protein ABGX00_15220 [Allomuricauda sp.]
MIKNFFMLLSIVFINTSAIEPNPDLTLNTIGTSDAIKQEIAQINNIIDTKQKKANALEEKAGVLFGNNQNSDQALKLLEEAKLQRMMIWKYKAAIATRLNR